MACWREARTVLLYHALSDEPDLQSLLDEGLLQGKQLLLPVVVGDDLVLKYFKGKDSLREGAFHILEPVGEDFPLAQYHQIDLEVVAITTVSSLAFHMPTPWASASHFNSSTPFLPSHTTSLSAR